MGNSSQPMPNLRLENVDVDLPISYANILSVTTTDREVLLNFAHAAPNLDLTGGTLTELTARVVSRLVLPRQTGVELLQLLAQQLNYTLEGRDGATQR